MPADHAEAETDDGSIESALAKWQQGDYTISIREFVAASGLDGGALEIDTDPVEGLVVVSQTCDIVNFVPDRAYVVVCPLVRVTEKKLEEIRRGRTPSATVLEFPPEPTIVADLSRMMSVSKTLLAPLERKVGFKTDTARNRFAESLERKHGRFAFPNVFNDCILSKLRDRILSSHSKEASMHGKVYRSVKTVRATAFPSWDAVTMRVHFHFVLGGEATREASRSEIASTLDDHLGKLDWPPDIHPNDPLYYLVTLEDMTAAEWTQSQPIDWNFISWSGKPLKS